MKKVHREIRRWIRKFPENRLVAHHGLVCVKEYGCPNAANLFLQRWEAPVAVSGGCNAACQGCISKQDSTSIQSPQARIGFVPTVEEIVEIAVPHLEKAPRAMISFGQGCEGEPLLKGDLIKTNLIIPGRGTLVSISNNTALNLFNNFTLQDNSPTAPKPNGAPGPPTPPAFTGYIPLIADTTILNGNSRIKTDPQVTAYNTGAGKIITSEGLIYNGLKEKPFPFFAFGNLNISDPNLQPWLNSKGDWAAYKFDTLIINGTPEFVYDNNIRLLSINSNFVQPPQIGNVLLSALNNISLDANNPLAQSIGGVAASTSRPTRSGPGTCLEVTWTW